MKIKVSIIFVLISWLWLCGIHAQTVRTISVGQGASYTDHLSLKEDVKDMDLMVKFVFNEEANNLTVTLISYRTLFVFWDNVHFKPLIKGRKLRPDQLPYVVEYNPKDKFKVSKLFKASIPKPTKEFFFNRWIDYEGLQPAPQDYKMVNDFISQTFDIQNKRDLVTIRLRDVFLMDKIEKKKYNLYNIPLGRDLNLEYKITIMRNPCFGLDDELASAKKALEGITTNYATLSKRFGNRLVPTQETKTLLDGLKATIQDQFPPKSVDSPCKDIQETWNKYNLYVDSIAALKCEVESVESTVAASSFSPDGLKILMAKSRQIDIIVSRWLMSKDPIECRDLISQGRRIIDEVNAMIGKRTGNTAEQQKAVATFRAAERYFNSTCK
jgi:hypothetical protein